MRFKFDFDWICHDIEFDFSLLKDFFADIYEALPSISARIETDMDSYLKGITDPEEYQATASGLLSEHYNKFEEVYPNQLCYNYLISLYSRIEANIDKMCDDLVARKKLPFSLSGFSGHLPDRIRHFFLAFGLPAMEDAEVQMLKVLTKLRNTIVHGDGKVSQKEKTLRNILENTEGLALTNGYIKVDYGYCVKMQNDSIALFRKLFARLGYRTSYTVSKVGPQLKTT
jgi:hypothetical protein